MTEECESFYPLLLYIRPHCCPINFLQSRETYLIDGRGYFGFFQTGSLLRDLGSWIRHRLRCAQWKQWKSYLGCRAELIRLGVSRELALPAAWKAKGSWRIRQISRVRIALDNDYFDAMELPRFG